MCQLTKWMIPASLGLVLLAALGLQLLADFKPVQEGTLKEPLSLSIPAELNGWIITELDLGPTESVVERSRNLLRLDDFVHREYARGDRRFSVYVAYWKPGKMPVRLVNQHTPDRCWTEVGWTCTDREWNVRKVVSGRTLQPAQWGVYEKDEFTNYTYFWHVVGGRVHWYGGERLNTKSSLTSIWEDFLKFGLNVHREQFFIRIVSPEPMDDLWNESAFQSVMESLAGLCLAEPVNGGMVAVR